jgi:hypothetical protein
MQYAEYSEYELEPCTIIFKLHHIILHIVHIILHIYASYIYMLQYAK